MVHITSPMHKNQELLHMLLAGCYRKCLSVLSCIALIMNTYAVYVYTTTEHESYFSRQRSWR